MKYVKRYGFLPFTRKYNKQLLDTELDYLKTPSKKAFYKPDELLGNKITDAEIK